MHVFFRVDLSNKIGLGHLKRCLRIAKLFKKSKVIFILSKKNKNYDFFKNYKFKIFEINNPNLNVRKDIKSTIKIIRKIKSNTKKILFIDSYKLGETWESEIKKKVDKLIAIDDLKRKHDVDLLINQNWYFKNNKKYFKIYKNIKNLAFGPNYHLCEKKLLTNNNKIFWTIFFGGSDNENYTLKVLKKISLIKNIKICVILLNSSKDNIRKIKDFIKKKNLKNIIIKKNLENLKKIFIKTKYYIGSGGSTSWERILYQIPSLIIATTDDQKDLSYNLSKNNLQLNMHKSKITSSKIFEKIKELESKRYEITQNMKYLIDNFGLERLKLFINNKPKPKLGFRNVEKSDLGFLYFCVNQPDAISSRFNNYEIPLSEHVKWFYKMLKSKNTLMFIMQANKIPVGFIRYDIINNYALIDIYTDNNFRNTNISSIILNKTITEIKRKKNICKFIAKVKPKNIRSKKFFQKNDFIFKNKQYEFERC